MKKKISACLWFNGQAMEAAEYYASVFENTGITEVMRNTSASPAGEEGSVLSVSFNIEDFEFLALNGGPGFTMNPAISFFVHCKDESEANALWEQLSKEGRVLMPIDSYHFSKRYGWVQDRFGASWQIMVPQQETNQKIVPCMLFTNEQFGNAERAMDFYVSIFRNAEKGFISRYGSEYSIPDAINYGAFKIQGQDFVVMENNESHEFRFNEGISFIIDCKNQEEVDFYWDSLTTKGGSEWQCGWLKDQFGIFWQVVPEILMPLLRSKDEEKANRTMRAMIKMKKLNLAALEAGSD